MTVHIPEALLWFFGVVIGVPAVAIILILLIAWFVRAGAYVVAGMARAYDLLLKGIQK